MTILAAIDLSEVTESVIQAIPDLAHIDETIYLLYVSEPNPEFVGFDVGPASVNTQLNEVFEQQKKQLNEYSSVLAQKGYTVKTIWANGVISDEIFEHAEKLKVKCIILGRHGHSALYNILVGSVAEVILKKSNIPVILIPKEPRMK